MKFVRILYLFVEWMHHNNNNTIYIQYEYDDNDCIE